jgi:16S rRNA (cytidine1402-2'-O)-methyltransferase
VVATPIGNLEDVSLRALRVLRESSYVVAEDTRVTARLLARYEIRTPTLSLHAHSSPRHLKDVARRLAHGDLALVSDAGTPGISDPAADLVRAARELGYQVMPIPGPSAVTALLSVAGVPADQFTMVGFLPRRAAERSRVLEQVDRHEWPLVVLEAPHRLVRTLASLADALGNRSVVVGRELTKMHEEIWLGRLLDAVSEWSAREPRGEFVIVIEGAVREEDEPWTDEAVLKEMSQAVGSGVGAREASKSVGARAHRPARDVYSLWHLGAGGRHD